MFSPLGGFGEDDAVSKDKYDGDDTSQYTGEQKRPLGSDVSIQFLLTKHHGDSLYPVQPGDKL